MSELTVLSYAQSILIHVPWTHWMVMGVASLALTGLLLIRKKCSVYGAIAFGLTVFMGLFVLDNAILIRCGDGINHAGEFSLAAEYHRLIHGGAVRWTEMLANVAVFVPFGFFLSESLSTTKCFGIWRRIGLATLYAFGLSLLIESLQLLLLLGVFEITDLVMNTLGGFVGAGIAVMFRAILGQTRREEVSHLKP